MSASNEPVVVKKYANRRLYNTATSTYVTLENLAQMVKEGTEFNVYDAKSNEDITRSVLTQIIVEEEGKSGQNLLPVGFLRRLIGFYGDSMQWMVPKYLEHSMQSLTKNQDQIRDYFQSTFGGMFPFGSTLEQMSKQNMAMFERTMRMFSPLGANASSSASDSSESASSEEKSTSSSSSSAPSSSPSSSAPSPFVRPVDATSSKGAAQEQASETVSSSGSVSSRRPTSVSAIPTPETNRASQSNAGGEDVQNKIAALQRQLSDLAKNKA